MSVIETISDDLKRALKAGNKTKVSILRMIMSTVRNREIEKKAPLDDDEVTAIVKTFVKRGKESIEQFEKAGRSELVEKEKQELAVIQNYLPKQLSEEETRSMISDIVNAVGAQGPKDMGKVMKELMRQSAGQIDGRLANKLLKEILEV
ncbi:MAG: GatB/YqeY domain-containing protein [Nitrospiraceae bacterium]|nr:MAG: GatB/YqeY domain-containing protein [Nitrospiraceae bacterium]